MSSTPIEILDPRARTPDQHATPTFALQRLEGTVVGLRLDHSWRSYMVVVEEWERLLRADGAVPEVLWTGERVGSEGERTRSDIDRWAELVECGVIGLGN